jgi:hypothetical protein
MIENPEVDSDHSFKSFCHESSNEAVSDHEEYEIKRDFKKDYNSGISSICIEKIYEKKEIMVQVMKETKFHRPEIYHTH